MDFLKRASTEDVSIKDLRDWIVSQNSQTNMGLVKVAALDHIIDNEPVYKVLTAIINKYISNVKSAGVELHQDPIGKLLLKLADDYTAQDLDNFWKALSPDQRLLLCMGLPESVFNFQKRAGIDAETLFLSSALKAVKQDALADLLLDDYQSFGALSRLIDDMTMEVIKNDRTRY